MNILASSASPLYLLDTNTCIRYLSTDVVRSLARQRAFFAPFVSLPFDDPAAEAYSHVRADLLTAGMPIGPKDMLIAAIAANSLMLVTHNTAEFQRVPGLSLDDWE